MVTIGHISIDENNNISGGDAGDQTGREACEREFYVHKYGWDVLRPKEEDVAELIATCMKEICANPYIGYDQRERLTLYNAAKVLNFHCDRETLKIYVEADCSSGVRVCLARAGIMVANFTTASEKRILMNTGRFDLLECAADGSNLKRGDILVSKKKGHTVVVLQNSVTSGSCIGTATARMSMKVRDAATTKGSTPIGSVGVGKAVKVLEVLDNGWLKIEWKKTLCGYAYTSNVGNRYYIVVLNSNGAVIGNKDLKPAAARCKDMNLSRKWTTTIPLNLRAKPGVMSDDNIILKIPQGEQVRCYGFYTEISGVKWLCVTYDGYTGYSSEEYLK